MMRIADIQTSLYRIPITGMADSLRGSMPYFELVRLAIRTSDGGDGESFLTMAPAGGSGVIRLVEDYVAPLLHGFDGTDISSAAETARLAVYHAGGGGFASSVASLVDMTLWDHLGKRTNTPVHALLGKGNGGTAVYASGIDLGLDSAELAERARAAVAAGVAGVKIKVGSADSDRDLQRVAAVREAIGDDRLLMVDANRRWSRGEAQRHAERLATFGVDWLEEPLTHDSVEDYNWLTQRSPIPIAAGENMSGMRQLSSFIMSRAVDVIQLNAALCGGISIAHHLSALAKAYGVRVASHGPPEVAVALLSGEELPTMIELHGFDVQPFLRRPFDVRDGWLIPNGLAGLGLQFDEDALAQHRVRVPAPEAAASEGMAEA